MELNTPTNWQYELLEYVFEDLLDEINAAYTTEELDKLAWGCMSGGAIAGLVGDGMVYAVELLVTYIEERKRLLQEHPCLPGIEPPEHYITSRQSQAHTGMEVQ